MRLWLVANGMMKAMCGRDISVRLRDDRSFHGREQLESPNPITALYVMITRCPTPRMIPLGTLSECHKGAVSPFGFPHLALQSLAHHLPRAWAVRLPAISRACVFYGPASGLQGPPNTQFSL